MHEDYAVRRGPRNLGHRRQGRQFAINVLAFPGVFRGLLDAQGRKVTDRMLVAAARALADVVLPDEIGPDYIIPSVFHPDVASGVAAAG